MTPADDAEGAHAHAHDGVGSGWDPIFAAATGNNLFCLHPAVPL